MADKKIPKVTLNVEEVQFAFGPYVQLEAVVVGDGVIMPSGVVAFRRNSINMGNSMLNKHGNATLKYSGFKAEPYDLVAVYAGDENYEMVNSNAIEYVPTLATLTTPTPTLPPGATEAPPIDVSEDKREVEFMVDLSGGVSAPLPSSRENYNNLVAVRHINMSGVGTNLKHGYKFKLIGEEAKRVYRAYKEFLQVLSGGFYA